MTVRQPTLGLWWSGILMVSWLVGPAEPAPTPPTLAASDTSQEEEIRITIHGRKFIPPTVTIHAGRKTRLVFHNKDAELHAVVPGKLFFGVNLNIGGNGAPEFNDEGFKRVIIPSEGLAELRFVLERPGVYPYICDMPGHEMRATIVVEEPSTANSK